MNGTRIGAGDRPYLYASTAATYDETADLDYIAIEYALNGETVKLTLAEKIHAARILDGRGLSDKAIGERIGSDTSTVRGWRDNGWKPGGTKPARQPRQLKPCGTRAAYARHRSRGEQPCDACRAANASADRRYRLTGIPKEAEQ
jgi:hypothetical protein